MLNKKIKPEDVPESLKSILKLNGKNPSTKRSVFMKAVAEDNREKLSLLFEKAKKENVNLFNYIYDYNISVINMLLKENAHAHKTIMAKYKNEENGDYGAICKEHWDSRINYLKENGFDLFSLQLIKISEKEDNLTVKQPESLFEILNNVEQYDQSEFIRAYFTDNEIQNVVNLVKEEKIEKYQIVEYIKNNINYYNDNEAGALCKALVDNDLLTGHFFKLPVYTVLLLQEQGYVDFYAQLKKETIITSEIIKFSQKILESTFEGSLYSDFLIKLYEEVKWSFAEINSKIVCPSNQLLNCQYTEDQFTFISRYSDDVYATSNTFFYNYMKKIENFQEKYPSLIFHFNLDKEIEFNRFACLTGLFIDYKNHVNNDIDIRQKLSEMGIRVQEDIIYSSLCKVKSDSDSPYQKKGHSFNSWFRDNGMYNLSISPFLFSKIIDDFVSQQEIDGACGKISSACNNYDLDYDSKDEKIMYYVNKLSFVEFQKFINTVPSLIVSYLLKEKENEILLPKVINALKENSSTEMIRYLGELNLHKKSLSEANSSFFNFDSQKEETEDLFQALLLVSYEFLKDDEERIEKMKKDFDEMGLKIENRVVTKLQKNEFLNLFFERLDLEKITQSVLPLSRKVMNRI